MSDKYKVFVRTAAPVEIGEFGDMDMITGVREILDKALRAKLIGTVETMTAMPLVVAQRIGAGVGFDGGPEVLETQLFTPLGDPIDERSFEVVEDTGLFTVVVKANPSAEKGEPLGAFTEEAVAHMVGEFWRNGHLG